MTTVREILKIVSAALREIFDEAAYSRYLQRAKISSSAEAYAAFTQERDSMHARRHRCC